ncbi:hypothetical protein BST81_20390 [Leptolyngbya sp. 'hensonii']|nr:hypothetical protein BST81_20390 [Leptolyngbya sp. 'hensonii']
MGTRQIQNKAGFKTISGLATDEVRDRQMRADSDRDIAWVHPGREQFGPQCNQSLIRALQPVSPAWRANCKAPPYFST